MTATSKPRSVLQLGVVVVLLFIAFTVYTESRFLSQLTGSISGIELMRETFSASGSGAATSGMPHDLVVSNTETAPNTPATSMFDKAALNVYESILQEQKERLTSSSSNNNNNNSNKTFDLATWESRTEGGLLDNDRKLMAAFYGNATSVFEYGVGESTYIANHMGVPRYAGVDSHPGYLDSIRAKVSPHFRFYYGDVGDVKAWGYPSNDKLTKILWQYQVVPLYAEPEPFDVYLVDGRYRMACVLFSFLHASARGAKHEDTTVLLHDCWRGYYHANDDILQLVDNSIHQETKTKMLCVYKRKANTTDEELLLRYENIKFDPR